MADPTDEELALSSNVVKFEDFKFSRKSRRHGFYSKGECPHLDLTLDDEGQIITCDDCNKQVSAYWSILRFLDEWRRAWQTIRSRQKECDRIERSQVVLRAAKVVESAWRSRRSVPCCPHCRKAILTIDGFGRRYSVNKKMEVKRREKKLSQKDKSCSE